MLGSNLLARHYFYSHPYRRLFCYSLFSSGHPVEDGDFSRLLRLVHIQFLWNYYATVYCNIEVLDFIEGQTWLQKGSFLQQDSNLCHDPLLPHHSNRGWKALGCQELRKWWMGKSVVRPVPAECNGTDKKGR